MQNLHAVTGAFGYSGKYIAQRLLDESHQVITLTNSPHRRHHFRKDIEAVPFDFENPKKLTESLKGVEVLYNTYWVRFNHRTFAQADAVKNTITLFNSAKDAGVERIVHVSISNPSEDSDLEYFKYKAELEKALIETNVSYSILRPTVLFGKEDILINNIAWSLRHFPFIGVFGDGSYKLQPIYVDDLAALAVKQGKNRDNTVINAIGPETFAFKGLVQEIGNIIGKKRLIISVPPSLGYITGKIIGFFMNDIMITREEIKGLMRELLYVDEPPTGTTKLTEWTKKHADTLGRKYTSELMRRIDRKTEYESN
ncbi:MAG: NAD(P)H-binding protein [Ignavibacteria bacterium]|nr:NAD(P)H-binding protein [Ignavibacteria bacterium]